MKVMIFNSDTMQFELCNVDLADALLTQLEKNVQDNKPK